MPKNLSPKSSKIGCLYKAVYIERMLCIVDELEFSYKVWLYPSNIITSISKDEWEASEINKEIEFVELMPYDIVRELLKTPDPKHNLKHTYDDYNRRKQSIIQSELLDSDL